MEYNKDSFLAGVAVGRTLKGWASGAGAGGSGSDVDTADPWSVYERTKPAGWTDLPTPAANEMYLIVHIPDGGQALLGLAVTAKDFSRVTYQIGTYADGEYTAITKKTAASSVHVEFTLDAADYVDLPQTSDGYLQAIVKISGTDVQAVMWDYHSAKYNQSLSVYKQYTDWPIVAVLGNLPSLSLPVGKALDSAGNALANTSYTQFFGLSCPKSSANGDVIHRFSTSNNLVVSLHNLS